MTHLRWQRFALIWILGLAAGEAVSGTIGGIQAGNETLIETGGAICVINVTLMMILIGSLARPR